MKRPGLKIEAKGFRISVFQARRPKFPRRYLLYTLEFKGLEGKRLGGGGGGRGEGGKRLGGETSCYQFSHTLKNFVSIDFGVYAYIQKVLLSFSEKRYFVTLKPLLKL